MGIHWTNSKEACKSVEITGIAIFKILPSKETMKVPTDTIPRTICLYSGM